MYPNVLPFPRGKTWGDGQVTLDATSGANLLGKLFEVPDTVNGTGQSVVLRVVKNDSGSAIAVARKGIAYHTGAKDFGRFASGYVGATGGYGQPLDDAYTIGANIAANDLFYVVEQGPCQLYVTGTSTPVLQHKPIMYASSGYGGVTTAGAGQFVIGMTDVAGTATTNAVLIHVKKPDYN